MKHLSLAGVRRVLIVAPHPDDEAIGAYGLIRALKARSARVWVVVVTDGAGSHRGSVRWPTRRLIAERRRETLAVMRGVGITARDVAFLDFPDGSLSADAAPVRVALRRATARLNSADLLVLPAPDDDHPDHRAVAAALRLHAARRLQYLVWPARHEVTRRASHQLRLGTGGAAKRGAIRRYRSQMGIITDDPSGFAISCPDLARFAHPVERFREMRR